MKKQLHKRIKEELKWRNFGIALRWAKLLNSVKELQAYSFSAFKTLCKV